MRQGKVFTPVRDSGHRGVSVPLPPGQRAPWQTPPRQTIPGRHLPGQTPLLRRNSPLDTTGYGQQAGGTHPTLVNSPNQRFQRIINEGQFKYPVFYQCLGGGCSPLHKGLQVRKIILKAAIYLVVLRTKLGRTISRELRCHDVESSEKSFFVTCSVIHATPSSTAKSDSSLIQTVNEAGRIMCSYFIYITRFTH